jgi:hypothetical protein
MVLGENFGGLLAFDCLFNITFGDVKEKKRLINGLSSGAREYSVPSNLIH